MAKMLGLAGANGSGKSTITTRISTIGYYINADEIKKQLGCTDLEAAQIAENTREYCLANGYDFTFETVLSTDRNLILMKRAKDAGYYVICIYVLTNNPDINVARVAKRVSLGGHDVTEEKVRERYPKTLASIPQLLSLCNELYVFDNSMDAEEGEPKLIISSSNGNIELRPNEVWSQDMIECLIDGTYYSKYISES